MVEGGFHLGDGEFVLGEEGRDGLGGRGDKERVVGRVEVEAAEAFTGLIEELNFMLKNLLMFKYVHILQ